MNNFTKLKQGIQSGLPIALGYFPIAIAFGALAAQAQLRQPPKKKDSEEKINCQYCGRELTKGEQLTHSCQKKPKKSVL